MNRVIQDGIELFDVTVTITDGQAVVTPNTQPAPNPTPESGGGPGEEH